MWNNRYEPEKWRHRRRFAYGDRVSFTAVGTPPEPKTFGSDLVAETVRPTVGHYRGVGATVSMVTGKGGLGEDSPPALVTVLVIMCCPSVNAVVGWMVLAP